MEKKHMKSIFLLYLFAVSIVAFILYGVDKSRAKNGKWRISEDVLLGIAVIGGSIGAILGMLVFRHKTKHWYFRYGLWIILALQIILVLVFHKRLGF